MKLTLNTVTTVPAGVALRLTPEQAAARGYALEPYGKQKNVFVGTQALQFKAGETVEIVGNLPKGILPIYDAASAAAVESIPEEAAPSTEQ
jgi:hypothetical protein